jgi:dCTP deaminase
MLADHQIKYNLLRNRLTISHYQPAHLQPASYDVLLHPIVLILKDGMPLDPKRDSSDEWTPTLLPDDGLVLRGVQFAIGSTWETFHLRCGLAGQLHGRSGLGRLGLMVHSTAGFLDPGFQGQVTLELSCVQGRGVRLYPMMPIAQIAFDVCSGVEALYDGKYVDQLGPTPSRYYENWREGAWA